MKRTIIVIILAGLLLLMMPTAVSAAGVSITGVVGEGAWDGDTWEVSMFPGESKSTVLTLYNSSSSSLDVELTVVPDSFDEGNLTFELNPTGFTMLGRSYTDVTLTVEASGSVTPSATSEAYTMELAIEYEVPPTPSRRPRPSEVVEPVEEEPIVPEPTEPEPEPVLPEPVVEEPEVIEPEPEVEEPEIEEPEVEEPTVEEPTAEEPDVEEPEKPELIIEPEQPGFPWGWIPGIVAGLGGLIWGIVYWRRRRKEEEEE